MKKFLAVVLSIQLAFATPVRAAEFSQEQWLTLFRKQIELTVQNYYLFLGKNYFDAAFLLSRDVQFAGAIAAVAGMRLQEQMRKIHGSGADRAQAFREILLLRSQAAHVAQQLDHQEAMWKGLKKLQSDQCSVQQTESFSKDFSVSATLAVREMLGQMKAQLDEVIEKMGPEIEINASLSIPLGGTNTSGHPQQSRPELASKPFWKTYEETVESSPTWSDPLSPLDVAIWTNIELPERRFIPVEKANRLSEVPLLHVGIGPSESSQEMYKFTGSFGLLGAGAGSFLGPVGAAVGAVVGAFIGGLIATLFGVETVVGKWTRIIRTQTEYILKAVETLEKNGSGGMAKKSCDEFVDNSQMKTLYAQIDTSMERGAEQIRGSLAAFETEYQQIAAEYADELETLMTEVFPVFLKSIDGAFDRYFAKVEQLSQESRDYVAKKIVPALGVVTDPKASAKTKWESQDKLWDALIDGQAQFSPPVGKGKVQELIYWEPAYKTILKKLEATP